ncbi:MAG: FHA domain-containing protein [Mycobacteriaceae bacterium]|nr:FHA domain-containing protein [Mycobacteriaceae bacterium]
MKQPDAAITQPDLPAIPPDGPVTRPEAGTRHDYGSFDDEATAAVGHPGAQAHPERHSQPEQSTAVPLDDTTVVLPDAELVGLRLSGGEATPQYRLRPGAELRLGRRESSPVHPDLVDLQRQNLVRDPSGSPGPETTFVSRDHASIGVHSNGDVYIRDNGSTYGTFVRGKTGGEKWVPPGQDVPVHHGDTVRLGPRYEVEVVLGKPTDGDTTVELVRPPGGFGEENPVPHISAEDGAVLWAAPLGPEVVGADGLPLQRRTYTKAEYIEMWENRIGRKLTLEELDTIDLGCIGLTMARLGLTDGAPPMNLAFRDPAVQPILAEMEGILAPGEVAGKRVTNYLRWLDDAKADLAAVQARPDIAQQPDLLARAARRVEFYEQGLATLQAEARQTWTGIADSYKQLELERTRTKIEGNRRAFANAFHYAEKLNAVLAKQPADAAEFLRMAYGDPELMRLRGVGEFLPAGSPSEWKAVVFSKHFWSGQRMTWDRDHTGTPIRDSDGKPQMRAMEHPDPKKFVPDPRTGQVDMSDDLFLGKPGYCNFDYGWYDEQTKSWWHANHGEYRDAAAQQRDPMKVFQSSDEKFFAGTPGYDAVVFGIAFVRESHSADRIPAMA